MIAISISSSIMSMNYTISKIVTCNLRFRSATPNASCCVFECEQLITFK